MKAITLYQPWASLWLTHRKVHETRSWQTYYRGPLVVHAGKRDPRMQAYSTVLYEIAHREFAAKWMDELPRGALLGIVQLSDCTPTERQRPIDHEDFVCGNWDPHRFAWRRLGFKLLPAPVLYKGRQGMFEVPDELVLPPQFTEVA